MKKILFVLLVLLVLVLSSCVSFFPEPESDQDTLVVIPFRKDITTTPDLLLTSTLHLYNENDEEVLIRDLTISQMNDDSFIFFKGLEQGTYYISHFEYNWQSVDLSTGEVVLEGEPSKTMHEKQDFSFQVTAGNLTLVDFYLDSFEEDVEGDTWALLFYRDATDEQIDESMNLILEHEESALWNIVVE